jgi:hypothetical protein
MRNAEGLDHVLGGGGPGAGHGELASPPLGGEEIVQLLVEAEGRRHHAKYRGKPPGVFTRGAMARLLRGMWTSRGESSTLLY